MGNIVDEITKNRMGDHCCQSPLKRSQRKYKHKKQHLSAPKKKGNISIKTENDVKYSYDINEVLDKLIEIERKYNLNEKHITNASFMDIIDFVNNSDDDYYDINYKLQAQKVQKMKDETRISIQSTLTEASNQQFAERVSIFYQIRNRSQHTINYWDINKNEKHITNASFMDIIDFVNNSTNNTSEIDIKHNDIGSSLSLFADPTNNKYPEISSVYRPIGNGPTLYRFEFIFLEDINDNNQLEVTRRRYDEYIYILCKYIYVYNLFIFQLNLSHDLYQELQYLLAQNGGNLDKLKKIKIYQQFV